MEPVLVTERLVLRRFTPDDVDGLRALDGDPAVMRYLGSRIKSRAEIETEVLPRVLGYYARYQDYGYFAADTRDGGEFIGWFAMRPVIPSADWIERWADGPEPAGIVSLGYRLRRGAWGSGVEYRLRRADWRASPE